MLFRRMPKTQNGRAKAGKSVTRSQRSATVKATKGTNQIQKTLPEMFQRGSNKKRKQLSQENESMDSQGAYSTAKKAPEQSMGCFYAGGFSTAGPSHVNATAYQGFHIQQQSSCMHGYFPSNFVHSNGGAMFQQSASTSSLYVSGMRRWDETESAARPNFRTRPPVNPQLLRSSLPPLPNIPWSDSGHMWNLMCWKDMVYCKDPHYFPRHPMIQPRMRAILLDWISEVCEVYKLHRETYHLTVDFVDRYMSKAQNVPKEKLQLVGVTALFIAAKLEEIYPPKCSEFATVTDGACDETEIRDQEVIMLKRLNWALSPVTVNNWLTVYLQLLQRECDVRLSTTNAARRSTPDFVYPKFNRHSFLQLTRLVDLCLLDTDSVRFPYGMIAASALCSLFEPEHAVLRVSGYRYEEIQTCVDWMRPFTETVKELGEAQIRIFESVQEEDHHNIQTHDFDLSLLDRAEHHRREMQKYRLSPDYTVNGAALNSIFPTPPQSDERPPMHLTRVPAYTLP